ncbi:MAG: fructose-6-phosphate aldolase [Clostridium chrysemydis]|uniref:fructose-6-phosphate aldolase n=1 Tax=Clostridium TaxID=1485 RepID=UPI002152F195|nr:fructose-6-phosphate aldolase [Clostridium sp. LY3-2]MCR6514150.1 fructose-6-phosphate aldolase [Clostridium sp. LY3-2]
MKLFIDTANIEEIKKINELGIISGVTTNPSLISKEKAILIDSIREISKLIEGPVSAEVTSDTAEGMVKEGKELSKINKNVVIKIPMSEEGLKAVKILNSESVKTNVTLVFSAMQALLAARAGATFVSPFIGRIDDIGNDSINVISDIVEIFKKHNISTEIISASIRSPKNVLDAARVGSNIATVPYKTLIQMISHPLTHIGIEKFNKDNKK